MSAEKKPSHSGVDEKAILEKAQELYKPVSNDPMDIHHAMKYQWVFGDGARWMRDKLTQSDSKETPPKKLRDDDKVRLNSIALDLPVLRDERPERLDPKALHDDINWLVALVLELLGSPNVLALTGKVQDE